MSMSQLHNLPERGSNLVFKCAGESRAHASKARRGGGTRATKRMMAPHCAPHEAMIGQAHRVFVAILIVVGPLSGSDATSALDNESQSRPRPSPHDLASRLLVARAALGHHAAPVSAAGDGQASLRRRWRGAHAGRTCVPSEDVAAASTWQKPAQPARPNTVSHTTDESASSARQGESHLVGCVSGCARSCPHRCTAGYFKPSEMR